MPKKTYNAEYEHDNWKKTKEMGKDRYWKFKASSVTEAQKKAKDHISKLIDGAKLVCLYHDEDGRFNDVTPEDVSEKDL